MRCSTTKAVSPSKWSKESCNANVLNSEMKHGAMHSRSGGHHIRRSLAFRRGSRVTPAGVGDRMSVTGFFLVLLTAALTMAANVLLRAGIDMAGGFSVASGSKLLNGLARLSSQLLFCGGFTILLPGRGGVVSRLCGGALESGVSDPHEADVQS